MWVCIWPARSCWEPGGWRRRGRSSCHASYFIQVNTEDFVEDRLLKDCEDDGRLTLSAKQLQRYRQVFFPKAQPEDYVDFCQMGQFERMQISRDLYNLARREMDELAKASGGRNFLAASLQDARAAFARVATEIGTQYSLGYYPSNKERDGKFRAIRVEVQGSTQNPRCALARDTMLRRAERVTQGGIQEIKQYLPSIISNFSFVISGRRQL